MFVVHPHAWESGSSFFVSFCTLTVIFQSCLDQISNSSNFFDLPLKVGIVVVRDLGKFEILLTLLWKLAELLLLANCWGANEIAVKFWLTCRAHLLMFSWWSSRGAVGSLFSNIVRTLVNLFFHSCHHMMRLFLLWIVQLTELVGREHHLGTGIAQERSPVGSRFSELLFLDVPATAMEQVRLCGFRLSSSSLDKAPKYVTPSEWTIWKIF